MNINDNKHVPKPDLTLGQIVICIDLDTNKYDVTIDNAQTMQLTTGNELLGVLSPTGVKLFCEELKRRSKIVVVV